MTHEGIEYVIRVGIGRNEWALLIYYPDKADGKPSWPSSREPEKRQTR
jgi:hypothetical protein